MPGQQTLGVNCHCLIVHDMQSHKVWMLGWFKVTLDADEFNDRSLLSYWQ
jgi:hypothetical protein